MSPNRAEGPSRPPVLAVRDLAVAYGGGRVLRGVTIEVESGSVVAVVGASGAGKTTLLRAVSGLLGFHRGRIVAGTVELDGRPSTGDDAAGMVRRGVAQVMEGGRVFPGLTVDENLQAGAGRGRGRERDREAAAATRARVLELFPILARRRRMPAGRLSGGERQMLAIGRALMSSPRLLLLDEPFLGLAPPLVEQVQSFLAGINAGGTTVVVAEQRAAAAFAVAHRAYVLANGTIAAEGAPADIGGRDIGRLYLSGDESAPAATATIPAAARPAAPPAPAPALLELARVTLRFGSVTALDDLSLQVGAGEIVAVIGPNGAGKTSVLNCVNQLYRPQGGSIRLDGAELQGRRPWAVAGLGVGRSFQRPALFDRLDVVGNLLVGRHRLMARGLAANAFGLGRSRREEADHRRRCEEIVDFLGLGAYRDRPAGELPYGVAKVVELGRAVAMDARLVLLDEPSAGLTEDETDHLARCILSLRQERGVTVLMVEHHVGLVARLADRVVVLDSGRAVADGPPGDVLADPEVARVYLGSGAAAR
ncbi:MAG: branched-chain amino acid transport system ATP-binding protein [Actinomycetota bacterium]|jgi:branched-chain amino acid transport system ATP-binding protein|nr:branched-chain amino acid transport system ATP-binding protein [Actinomycetota bacterium]